MPNDNEKQNITLAVFGVKLDNFVKENRDDRQRIFDEIKEVKTEVKAINGSVRCISKFKERAIGSISVLKILFVPVILSIIFLYLDKLLK